MPDRGQLRRRDHTSGARGAADRLRRSLAAGGIDHDIKVYPDAGHAFLNDHKDLAARIMKIARIGYHEASARDAQRRVVTLFRRHLRAP